MSAAYPPHNPEDCDQCGRREVVTYRCTACPYKVDVPGEYRFFVQGNGHWHCPDKRWLFIRVVTGHVATHKTPAGMVPITQCPP